MRVALSRTIFHALGNGAQNLPVITLEPQIEQMLGKSMQRSGPGGGDPEDIVLEPGLAERLQRSIAEAAQRQEAQGKTAVLLVPGPLRAVLSRFLRHTHRAMKVISYQEVPENRQITIEATVG